MNKEKWTLRMCNLADHWSQYSTCVRRKVGAVVFDPESFAVYGVGYNDTPTGAEDCGDGGCPECDKNRGSVTDLIQCECVHAEANAMLLARRDLRGAWIAVASRKDGERSVKNLCSNCRKHLRQAGVEAWCQTKLGEAAIVRHLHYDKMIIWHLNGSWAWKETHCPHL